MSAEPNRSPGEESEAKLFQSMSFETVGKDLSADEAARQTIDESRAEITTEDSAYPWNPAAPEADAYYSRLEQTFSLTDCFEPEEIDQQAEAFFGQLQQCWEAVDAEIEVSLSARFSNAPVSWLEIIARRAKDFIGTSFSRVQQLVECVKPLFADWAEEDLTLLARPIAQAIRGDSQFKKTAWEELSAADKARLSMAIAHYALTYLQTEGR
ncbi:MAG: hypothetical protein ACFB4I_17680 [Cyanophyceae cyanobacterium]